LAFGNGAPDVFSSIAAAKQNQVALSVGGVIGESLFITCVVLAACICVAGDIRVQTRLFLRDAGALLMALALLGLLWLQGSVSFLGALGFPLLYVAYVGVVLCTEHSEQDRSEKSRELQELTETMPVSVSWGDIHEDYVAAESPAPQFQRPQFRPAHALGTNLRWSLLRMNWWLARSRQSFSTLSIPGKALYLLTLPVRVLRRLTIPLYLEDTEWNRGRAAVTPPLALCLVLATVGCKSQTDMSWVGLLLAMLFGLPLGILIFCTSKRSTLPPYNFALVVSSFLLAICWICSVCDLMVEVLSLVGLLLGLPIEVLGMTLLALGNSAGDLWADTAVCRLGLSESAVSAVFAGPLFNLCVGIGVALLIRTWEATVSLALASPPVICYCFLIAVNIYTVTYYLLVRRLTPCHGKVLALVFAAFSLSLLL